MVYHFLYPRLHYQLILPRDRETAFPRFFSTSSSPILMSLFSLTIPFPRSTRHLLFTTRLFIQPLRYLYVSTYSFIVIVYNSIYRNIQVTHILVNACLNRTTCQAMIGHRAIKSLPCFRERGHTTVCHFLCCHTSATVAASLLRFNIRHHEY